jgi:hypothetical protein
VLFAVAGSGVAAHLVVAVGQVVVQGLLGGGVHGAGLGQVGLALQVLDRGGGLRARDAVDRAFVVVQLADPVTATALLITSGRRPDRR